MSKNAEVNKKCLCGSNKKYKVCCKQEHDAILLIDKDEDWKKVFETLEKLCRDIDTYIDENLPEDIFHEAIKEYQFGNEDYWDYMNEQMVELWFLFTAIPAQFASKRWSDLSKPMALIYMEKHSDKLTEYEKDFINALSETPISLFHIKEIVPAKLLMLKDLFLDCDYTAKHPGLSTDELKDSIVYGRVLKFNGQTLFIDSGNHVFLMNGGDRPQKLKLDISKIYTSGITAKELCKLSDVVRNEYFKLCIELVPEVDHDGLNEDGNGIDEYLALFYHLKCSIQEAFETIIGQQENCGYILYSKIEKDEDGNVTKYILEFWLDHIDDSVFIEISNGFMCFIAHENIATKILSHVDNIFDNRVEFENIVLASEAFELA